MTQEQQLPDGVAVYCASSRSLAPEYYEAGREMGRLIAQAGLALVNGGGVMGIMGACIRGCVDAGGTAIGVIPKFMDARGWAHPALTRKIVTDTMHQRKQAMADLSRAAVALPGGVGTLDELMEIMTWRQLGLFEGPAVIVNLGGYFDPLLQMMARMADEHFMRSDLRLARTAATPAEAMEIILAS